MKSEVATNYWLRKIDSLLPIEVIEKKVEEQHISIGKDALIYFNKITQGHPLSKVTVISTLFIFLLKKYNVGYDSFVSLENIKIGEANAVPLLLNVDLSFNQTLAENIESVRREILESLNYSKYSEAEITEKLNGYNLSDLTRFGICLDEKEVKNESEILLKIPDLNKEILCIKCCFNILFIEDYIITHLLRKLENILSSLEELVNSKLSNINILSDEDSQLVLNEFNNTQSDFSKNKTVLNFFEEHADLHPEWTALITDEKKITYKEVQDKSNQFSDYLQIKHNIGRGDFVAVKLERNESLIFVLYGILKAGAAYIPIGPEYPEKRINYILQDANAKILIDDLELNKFFLERSSLKKSIQKRRYFPEDICYVIYTSGTTGNPKGVMIKHRSLVNRLQWMQKVYPLKKDDVLIQKTPFTFDVSVWEIFWWSLYGAKLFIPNSDVEKNPKLIIRDIYKHDVSVIHFVPSMLTSFLKYIRSNFLEKIYLLSLKQVFASGEALKLSHVELFYQLLPEVNLMNLYGPTEATIDVSYYDCSISSPYGCIPIGRPIDNTKLYILDDNMDLLPIGTVGKLFIGGEGLAVGYINNTKLTKEKFTQNPFAKNEILYDSGDLARWLPDGNIEFKGRQDYQVKFRGFRIELGEIEHALIKISFISEAIVDIEKFNGEEVIIAYILTDEPLGNRNLREELVLRLPNYMIPNFFLELESLPLNENGKLDRSLLPKLNEYYRRRNNYVAPRNDTEWEVTRIWEEVLGIKEIGITDNFFDLGGHSLLMTEIINTIVKRLQLGVTVKAFLLNPTVEALVSVLTPHSYTDIPSISDYDELTL